MSDRRILCAKEGCPNSLTWSGDNSAGRSLLLLHGWREVGGGAWFCSDHPKRVAGAAKLER